MIVFLQKQIAAGDLDVTTGRAYISATRRVFSVLDQPLESIDLRTVRLDEVLRRFESSGIASNLEPVSLISYRGRVRAAVKKYLGWLGRQEPTSTPSRELPRRPPPSTAMVDYPFPVRAQVQAHLILPADLTQAEADRIARFVETLAIEAGGSATQAAPHDRS
jgi:hypothetical protein